MNTIYTQAGDELTVSFEGELTLEYASELKSILLDSLEKAGEIFIDMTKVERIDLSCLQLFYSAFRTAVEYGKSMCFEETASRILKAEAGAAGFVFYW